MKTLEELGNDLLKTVKESSDTQKAYKKAGYELWLYRFPDQDLQNGQMFSGNYFYISGDRWF